MCGINGILHLQPQKKVDERTLTKMRDSLEHRGTLTILRRSLDTKNGLGIPR